MIVSFCAVLFQRDVLDEFLDLIESVSEGFPTYSLLFSYLYLRGRSGGAMVLGKLPEPGRPTNLD